MTIYTGAKLTINGVLDEKIAVTFNNYDGEIGLAFIDADGADEVRLSYGAARQLIGALEVALNMRIKKEVPRA